MVSDRSAQMATSICCRHKRILADSRLSSWEKKGFLDSRKNHSKFNNVLRAVIIINAVKLFNDARRFVPPRCTLQTSVT